MSSRKCCYIVEEALFDECKSKFQGVPKSRRSWISLICNELDEPTFSNLKQPVYVSRQVYKHAVYVNTLEAPIYAKDKPMKGDRGSDIYRVGDALRQWTHLDCPTCECDEKLDQCWCICVVFCAEMTEAFILCKEAGIARKKLKNARTDYRAAVKKGAEAVEDENYQKWLTGKRPRKTLQNSACECNSCCECCCYCCQTQELKARCPSVQVVHPSAVLATLTIPKAHEWFSTQFQRAGSPIQDYRGDYGTPLMTLSQEANEMVVAACADQLAVRKDRRDGCICGSSAGEACRNFSYWQVPRPQSMFNPYIGTYSSNTSPLNCVTVPHYATAVVKDTDKPPVSEVVTLHKRTKRDSFQHSYPVLMLLHVPCNTSLPDIPPTS
eukprot:Platyproteum_vivax@DN6088_c0_g1_i4.p1